MVRTLILKSTSRHYDEPWTDNDYVVLDDKRHWTHLLVAPLTA